MFVAVLVVVGGRVVARLVPAAVAGEFLAEGAEHVLIDPGRAGSEQAIEDLPELRARCLLG
jgi:antitoxin (DNA-binding transcriptional repressor) of toxin-antitoxin stability system